eukprot:CAMPEP_0116847952 /NCGR_PEP_ID=MMETSP0418-20121206/14719_1 /TAXON_ID=1158023 /ORGANISM="Astrosyne radiata, Strain 13vi08-1A" /LENGTH=188 /DNA_ID=CAMNT_0004479453 /DNA_START=19 /DNA_END=586 /DNA_ORIENTATION=+
MAALKEAARSEPGDAVFIYFSGHSTSIVDRHGETLDGIQGTLVPVDAQEIMNGVIFGGRARKERAALISGRDILNKLIMRLKANVTMTCVVDSSYSGSLLGLPYRYTRGGDEMERDFSFPFKRLALRASGAVLALRPVLVSWYAGYYNNYRFGKEEHFVLEPFAKESWIFRSEVRTTMDFMDDKIMIE